MHTHECHELLFAPPTELLGRKLTVSGLNTLEVEFFSS